MKILNITIDDFGCFSGKSFDLGCDFNLITGNNESGKSTLISFIKFVLYGLPRKNQENLAERERIISSKTGRAAGSMRIQLENGEEYLIERKGILRVGEKRESYSEECRIIDMRSGAQVHKGENPGELFLGVPVSVFESTCLVRQMKSTEIDGEGVGDALSNMLLSADEAIDLQKALDRLDALRKSLLHKNGKGGELWAISEEIDALSTRLAKARADSARILTYTESVEELKKNALAKRRELDKLDDTVSAFNSISVIKRFDRLLEHKASLEGLKIKKDKIISDSSVDGALPGRELAVKAEEGMKSYSSAKEAYAHAERRLELAKKAKAEQKLRCPNLTADAIRHRGGIDTICGRLDDAAEKAKKIKNTAIILTVIALISVLAGAGAVALLPNILIVGLCLCGFAVIMTAVGIAMFSSSKKRALELSEGFSKWGFSESDGTHALRAYLAGAFDDELTSEKLDSEISLAISGSEMRRIDLERIAAETDSILSSWRVSSHTDRCEALAETARRVREYYKSLDGIEREIGLEAATVDRLTGELSQYSEADLRARVPAELIDSYDEGAADELERRRRFCSSALKSLSEKQIASERELVRLESESESPARVAELLEKAEKKYAEEKLRYDSAVAAYEALSAAGSNIRDSVTPVIRKLSGEYLSKFTDGKYLSLGVENGCIAVSAESEGGITKLELLSSGTRDAAYLALRLSLLDILFKNERPPVLLDESLSQLDDSRAKNILSILRELCASGGQCLLFTCHGREKEMTERLDNVKYIDL